MTDTWMLAGIVVVVLFVSVLFYQVVARIGFSTLVSIPLAVVTAVKNALLSAGLDSTKFYMLLEWVIETLTYFQAIYGEDVSIEDKVAKAVAYIKRLALDLNVSLTDSEMQLVAYVLSIGFTIMNVLNVGKPKNYQRLYTKMARAAKITPSEAASGLVRLNARMNARR